MKPFKDAEHLVRMAVLFLVGMCLFVGVRAFFVPKSFGEYGHYRADAVTEIAALPVVHAGHDTCEICHSEVAELKNKGQHAGVNCEACHGPQARHADDPSLIKPALPDTAMLCARCHEASAAKPKAFHQVVSAEHSSGLPCKTCHTPHNPSLKSGDEK